jgi:hypothetical protein
MLKNLHFVDDGAMMQTYLQYPLRRKGVVMLLTYLARRSQGVSDPLIRETDCAAPNAPRIRQCHFSRALGSG